jgi:hypothetical protein
VSWDACAVNMRSRWRLSRGLAIGSLLLCGLGCQGGTRQRVSGFPPASPGLAYPATGQPPSSVAPGSVAPGSVAPGSVAPGSVAPSSVAPGSVAPSSVVPSSRAFESYYAPQSPRQVGSAFLFLPGSARQQQVNFETVDGRAILDGDIMLGPATALPFRYGMPPLSSLDAKGAVALADRSYLWPNAEIPYQIDGSAQAKLSLIDWAVRHYASTALKLRPRTAADRDYVVFRDLGEGCWSYMGRQGGPQDIDVSGCAAGSIVHEILHAAGFYHEQSRGDRDQYISIMWDEISPEVRFNFDKRDARGQDVGPYDYDSIMHYPSTAGSKSGRPTIVPKLANARIGQRDGLSQLDRAAIESLYRPSSGLPRVALPPAPVPARQTPVVAVPAPVPPAASPRPGPAPSPLPPAISPSGAQTSGNTSFAGNFSSVQGNVSCTQGGVFAQCQYPGGTLFCAANGPDLACTWTGAGQGRAAFRRQPSGVLAGTWGNGFSATDRGSWDLVPVAGAAPAAASAAPIPAPPATRAPTAPAAPPAATATPLSGNFSSSRGPMACVESGTSLSCNFQEADGVSGRLDCTKSQSGLELSCAWITFLPRPATGRAAFTRRSAGDRILTGTWGLFFATTGAGNWTAQGQ